MYLRYQDFGEKMKQFGWIENLFAALINDSNESEQFLMNNV